MDELLLWLAAGGDVGVWVIAAVLWKFDRRIFRLETLFANHDKWEREAFKKDADSV